MTTDLTMLALSAIWCVLLVVPSGSGLIARLGFATALGNRQGLPELTGWAGRAGRAHRNAIENLVPFAALVLAVAVTNKASHLSALGAQLFFYGRVVHSLCYIAGITHLRTLAFAVSLAGTALVAIAFFS